MPFPSQTPKPFTRANIEAIRPGQKGCYGLLQQQTSGRTWIYVGKGDIRARLLAHLNGDNSCINNNWPMHWVDVVTDNFDELEVDLIQELSPHCNKRVG